jgi:5'-nucleotidase / UDP-sugar diphosphatase
VTRRPFLAAWILVLAFPVLAGAQATTSGLTILHTNDTHGHLLPFSYPTIVPAGSDLEQLKVRSDIGGIARRATLVRQIRTEQEGRGIPVWLVDIGDFSDGTPFSTEYKGEADVAAMNATGYDFVTFGNHEFNNTLTQLRKLVRLMKPPLLLANAIDRATQKPIGQIYHVENVGAVRVGLFGLVTSEAGSYPAAKEGVDILDPVKTASGLVETLRRQADIIVLLSHCGEDVDQRLAAEVPGIDVIIGGHSHTRLPIGDFVWHGDDLKQDDVNGTIIAQAFQWGGELGRLDLLFVKDARGVWRVGRYGARLLPITKEIAAEPSVAAVVDQFWQPIAQRFGEVVGRAAADFSSRGDDEAPYNLVADAVRETYGVDLEMENSGGVRAPLVAGDITRGDLVTMDPFDNTVVLFKATGSQIKDLLARYTPYVSGIRYRVTNGQLVEAAIGGRPVEDKRTYSGATNSYFSNLALKGIVQENTDRQRLAVVTEYVRQKQTLTPAYDGRRVIVGGKGRE